MFAVYFAQKAFVLHEGRLLAVRRDANDAHHPLRWEVPGGRLEIGENLDEHLEREVFEETGIRILPGEPFSIWKWNIKRQSLETPDTIIAVARVCSALTADLNTGGRVEGDNLDLAEWIPISKVRDYEWIPNMLPVLDSFLTKAIRPNQQGVSSWE